MSRESFNVENFDPDFDPDIEPEMYDRKRERPSKELPTCNLFPKKIREGQMIGEYESKQTIYLTLAHRINDLQKQIEKLEAKVEGLDNKK